MTRKIVITKEHPRYREIITFFETLKAKKEEQRKRVEKNLNKYYERFKRELLQRDEDIIRE